MFLTRVKIKIYASCVATPSEEILIVLCIFGSRSFRNSSIKRELSGDCLWGCPTCSVPKWNLNRQCTCSLGVKHKRTSQTPGAKTARSIPTQQLPGRLAHQMQMQHQMQFGVHAKHWEEGEFFKRCSEKLPCRSACISANISVNRSYSFWRQVRGWKSKWPLRCKI